MHHGNFPREGFIIEQDGIEYYLLKHIGYLGNKYKYNALWIDKYFNEINLCGGSIYVNPNDIICYGKIVNKNGSKRTSYWIDACIFDMNT